MKKLSFINIFAIFQFALLSIISCSSSLYGENAPFTASMISRYDFNSQSAVDSVSGVTASGTFHSSANTPSGLGYAYNPQGTFLTVTNNQFLSNAGTVSAWALSINPANGQKLVSGIGTGSSTFSLFVTGTPAQFGFEIRNASATTGYCDAWGKYFPTNSWVFCTATWTNGSMKLYTNGVLIKSGSFSYPWNPGTWYIGSGWNGYIDDVMVYNRALSSNEMKALVTYTMTNIPPSPPAPPAGEAAPFTNSLISRYDFDMRNSVDSVSGAVATGSYNPAPATPSGLGYAYAPMGGKLTITNPLPGNIGTFSAWIFAKKTNNMNFVESTNAYNTPNHFKWGQNSRVYFFERRNSTNYTKNFYSWGTSCKSNAWIFVTLTWTNGTINLYTNGFRIRGPETFVGTWNPGPFFLGNGWDGYLDDLHIHNRILTTTEMQSLKTYTLTNIPAAAPPVEGAPYTSSLSAWWNFDANNAVDSVSNITATGTFASTADTPAGSGKAFSTSGSGLTVTAPLPVAAGTISLWALTADNAVGGKLIYSAKDKNQFILEQKESSGSSVYGLTLYNSNGTPFYAVDWGNYVSNYQWNFWTVTWTNNEAKLYVNGVIERTINYNGFAPPWVGGSWQIGTGWAGFIDELRVHNRALSASEIVNLRTNSIGRANPLTYIAPPTPPGEPAPYSNSLIAWWNFDENTAIDSVSNVTASGTFKGVPYTPSGTGYAYAPSGGKLQVGFPIPTNSGTVTLWALVSNMDLQGSGNGNLIWCAKDKNRFTLNQHQGVYNFSVNNAAGTTTYGIDWGNVVPNYQWVMWTATWNNGNISLYVNGVKKRSGTFTYPWILGNWEIGGGWYGFIDDVRLYNRALSQKEITVLLTNSINRATPVPYVRVPQISGNGIVCRVSFDQTSGKMIDDVSYLPVTERLAMRLVPGAFGFAGTSGGNKTNALSVDLSNLSTTSAELTVGHWVRFGEGAVQSTANPVLLKLGSVSITTSSNSTGIVRVRNGATALFPDIDAKLFDTYWHHIALVAGSGNCTLYIDGKPRANSTWTNTWPLTTLTLGGAATTGSETIATFDELRLYTNALTATQVFHFGKSLPEFSLDGLPDRGVFDGTLRPVSPLITFMPAALPLLPSDTIAVYLSSTLSETVPIDATFLGRLNRLDASIANSARVDLSNIKERGFQNIYFVSSNRHGNYITRRTLNLVECATRPTFELDQPSKKLSAIGGIGDLLVTNCDDGAIGVLITNSSRWVASTSPLLVDGFHQIELRLPATVSSGMDITFFPVGNELLNNISVSLFPDGSSGLKTMYEGVPSLVASKVAVWNPASPGSVRIDVLISKDFRAWVNSAPLYSFNFDALGSIPEAGKIAVAVTNMPLIVTSMKSWSSTNFPVHILSTDWTKDTLTLDFQIPNLGIPYLLEKNGGMENSQIISLGTPVSETIRYTDTDPGNGGTYRVYLKGVSFSSTTFRLTRPVVKEEKLDPVGKLLTDTLWRPNQGALNFSPAASWGAYSFRIYDLSGSLVRKIRLDEMSLWDGATQDGRNVPSGIYLIHTLDIVGELMSVEMLLLIR